MPRRTQTSLPTISGRQRSRPVVRRAGRPRGPRGRGRRSGEGSTVGGCHRSRANGRASRCRRPTPDRLATLALAPERRLGVAAPDRRRTRTQRPPISCSRLRVRRRGGRVAVRSGVLRGLLRERLLARPDRELGEPLRRGGFVVLKRLRARAAEGRPSRPDAAQRCGDESEDAGGVAASSSRSSISRMGCSPRPGVGGERQPSVAFTGRNVLVGGRIGPRTEMPRSASQRAAFSSGPGTPDSSPRNETGSPNLRAQPVLTRAIAAPVVTPASCSAAASSSWVIRCAGGKTSWPWMAATSGRRPRRTSGDLLVHAVRGEPATALGLAADAAVEEAPRRRGRVHRYASRRAPGHDQFVRARAAVFSVAVAVAAEERDAERRLVGGMRNTSSDGCERW